MDDLWELYYEFEDAINYASEHPSVVFVPLSLAVCVIFFPITRFFVVRRLALSRALLVCSTVLADRICAVACSALCSTRGTH
jgi:hypothetical protein